MGLLEKKVAVITGASSGIGKKTAEIFAKEGAVVVLAARRLEKLQEVENEIREKGGEETNRMYAVRKLILKEVFHALY